MLAVCIPFWCFLFPALAGRCARSSSWAAGGAGKAKSCAAGRRSSALIPSPGSTQINYIVILGMGTPYHTCSGKSRGKSVDIRLICGPAGEPSPDRPVSGSDVEEPQSGDPANRELSYGSGPVARAYFESRSGSSALSSSGRTARRGEQ